jgi:hypothetical protein
MPNKYYRKGFNGAEALKEKFVEAEGAVEAVAEVVCGAPEGGHLGSLRHGVLSKQILHEKDTCAK